MQLKYNRESLYTMLPFTRLLCRTKILIPEIFNNIFLRLMLLIYVKMTRIGRFAKGAAIVFLLTLSLCFLSLPFAHAVNIPDNPGNHVVDLAGIVDDSIEMQLNQYLTELEQKTTAQIAVLTIKSLEGESIEDLSISVAHDRWKLGQKGKDNGILLLVSFMDRQYRIEVGYGLEAVIPDSLAGSIGRAYLVPFFKKGDYSNGIFAAVTVIANLIADDSGVKITGMPALKRSAARRGEGKSTGIVGTIISLLVLVVLIILFVRNPRLFLMFFLLSAIGGRRGMWGGGGGFGGGGFGGGGGGFGGGGVSGGW